MSFLDAMLLVGSIGIAVLAAGVFLLRLVGALATCRAMASGGCPKPPSGDVPAATAFRNRARGGRSDAVGSMAMRANGVRRGM